MRPTRHFLTPVALALTTLGAFALRVFRLDAQSLWYDEGVTAEVARRGIAELTRWTANDIQPPLYYYLVAAWGNAAGWSEWSLRFPSVFFGTLAVPLLAAVTYSLTRRRSAGLLAALFAAIHPLLVYYSQEARMYAMLTALGILLAYLVVHAESGIRHRPAHWAAYIVVATASIYTHYFAFFLLLALSIAFFVDQLVVLPLLSRSAAPGAGRNTVAGAMRGPVLGFVLANLVVLILYLPWMSTLITRLTIDASYWAGPLKMGEALRHIGISFVGGETVLEEQAVRLLVPYTIATAALLPPLVWRNPGQARSALYAVLWLTIPIGGVLLLASMVPKFNARYVMIALPGLILLWAAGLAELSAFSNWNLLRGFRTPGAALRSAFAITLTTVLFAGFIYADRNWFVDPAFTKAEWRQLVDHIRSELEQQGDETGEKSKVILVSGHSWPVWNYYAADLPPLRLPDLEILDVNAILDFASSAIPLRDALTDKTDAWLVEWQGEIVDPMDIVPLQLNLAGREVEVEPKFWHLQLSHFTGVDADAVLVEPTAINERSINFGNLVYLLDYTMADNGDLLFFWQIHPDHKGPMPDLQIAGNTVTGDGLPVYRMSDRRPASYEYPAFRWATDQITLGRIRAEEWAGPGALPGPYRFGLSVYNPEGDLTGVDVVGDEGQPLGKQIRFDIDLPAATTGPDEMNEVTFAQIIPDLFTELILAAEQAEPGEVVPVEMHWYAEEKPPGDYEMLIRWRQRSTDTVIDEQVLPLSRLPTSQWPDDEQLRTLHALRPPFGLPPDDYWLEIGLTAPDSSFVRVPFRVLTSTRIFQPPRVTTPIDETFGDGLQLIGVLEPIRNEMRPQEQVALTFVWRATDRIPGDFSVTLQWLDEEGKPAVQVDTPLPGGSAQWLPGQVEFQSFFTAAPSEPGNYSLMIAVYDAYQPDLPRLRTSTGQDMLILEQVTVLEE